MTQHAQQQDAVATMNSADVAAAFGEFMTAFEAFKEANDERLSKMENGQRSDPLIEEKMARIETTLDRIQADSLRRLRPALMNSNDTSEAKSAFDRYLRKGDVSQLLALEGKSMSVGSDPDGGYLVPDQIETTLNAALREESPMRAVAGNIQVSASIYKRPFVTTGAATGWVGETESRVETDSPRLSELSYPTMELYACPAATSKLLDDSVVNIDAWLNREIVDAFAAEESNAFVSGSGVNQPKGFLSYSQIANSNWTWGNIGYVATGAAGAFPEQFASDLLLDLVFSLKSAYRKNGRFLMNRMTQSVVRRFKDENGNYLWQPNLGATLQPTLLGFNVEECDEMPDIAVDSASIAFGDFKRGYLIVDRKGVQLLRDPYTAKPYVLFYVTKRVGGGVSDFNAIKVMKFSA